MLEVLDIGVAAMNVECVDSPTVLSAGPRPRFPETVSGAPHLRGAPRRQHLGESRIRRVVSNAAHVARFTSFAPARAFARNASSTHVARAFDAAHCVTRSSTTSFHVRDGDGDARKDRRKESTSR